MRIAQAPTIRAVVLDLDDCLYPERQYVRGGYGAAARHLRSLGYEGPFETWLWSRFLRGEGGGAFDALNAAFALGLSPDRLEQLVRVYREHVPSIRPRGGMIELLGRLHEHFRMGLLSDGYLPAQRLKLAALKIERFFDAVVLTEELGRGAWKPSPVGFEAIREKLGVPHGACAYVGDNPAKDFLAPNRLGWRTIQYLCPAQIHASRPAPPGGDPRRIVRSPDQLRAALM